MKRTVKTIFVTLLALIFALGAFGCKPYKRGGTIERTEYSVNLDLPATYSATIEVVRPDNDPEKKILDALIAGFNEKYPSITVRTSLITIDSYNSEVVKRANADMLSDIIWCNSGNYYFLISNDIALDLNAFYDAAKKQAVINYDKDFTDDFKNMGNYNGLSFAVPRSADSIVTFYNKEVLTAAGVDLSVLKNGWTLDDFLGVCQKVRDHFDREGHTTYYPIDPNLNWESVAYPIIKAMGGEVIDKDGNFALTVEANAKVCALVKELVNRRFIPTANDATSNFESGTGAMLFQSATIDKYQNMAATRDKFDVCTFPLISGEDSAIGYGFAGYALNKSVLKDEAKRNAACAFIAYLLSYEGQQKLAKDGGLTLPSVRKDLSIDEPKAEWSKQYQGFNIEAYVWGSKYKTDLPFLGYVDPIYSADIVSAIKTYVGVDAVKETAADAYGYFKDNIEEAFKSVVV